MTEFEKALGERVARVIRRAVFDASNIRTIPAPLAEEKVCAEDALRLKNDLCDGAIREVEEALRSLSTHKAAPVSDGVVERVALAITQEIGWGTFDHFDPGDVRRISAAALKASGLDEAIEALDLAANRLARCSLEPKYGTAQRYEWQEWADEARTTLDKLRSAS